jgi:hypothetical protein
VSSRDGRFRVVFPVTPCGGLVVAGAGLQAAVQDADEPIRQPSQAVVVFDSSGAEPVVEEAGAGRGVQGGEGLRVERVDEPVVVDEAGRDHLLLPRCPGDGGGGGVVAAGLAVGVAVRVIAELAEQTGVTAPKGLLEEMQA